MTDNLKTEPLTLTNIIFELFENVCVCLRSAVFRLFTEFDYMQHWHVHFIRSFLYMPINLCVSFFSCLFIVTKYVNMYWNVIWRWHRNKYAMTMNSNLFMDSNVALVIWPDDGRNCKRIFILIELDVGHIKQLSIAYEHSLANDSVCLFRVIVHGINVLS